MEGAAKKNSHFDGALEMKDVTEKDVFFEDIMERCCGSGRWQILLVGYMSIMWLIFPAISMSMMFIGATPEFKCADGFAANATFASLPADTPRCHRLNASDACTRWVFDTSLYESTVVTEWNLVCGRKPLLSMLQSWLMIGGLVGSLVSGQLADRFGRRPVFLLTTLMMIGCVFSAAFVTDYSSYAAVRFLTGVAMSAMVGSHCVMTMELASCRLRAAFGCMSALPYAFGIMLVAAGSYAIRTRWQLQLAYAVPFLVLLPNFWLRPESPHWLVVQGRFAEAYEILQQGARWNGRQMPPREEVLELMQQAKDGLLAREAALKRAGGQRQGARQLVSSPLLLRYTLAGAFISYVISGSYFGITFDTTQLSASPHLAAVLSGLVEVPSYFVFPVLNRLGRRPALVLFLLTAAAAMFLVFAEQDATLWLMLGLVAKFGVSAAFGTIWVQINECMPTTVRGLAFGVCQMGVRLGGAASPFVVDLVSELHAAAPSAVFGVAVLLAALVGLLLPETNNRPLPETAADLERKPAAKKVASLEEVRRDVTADVEEVDGSEMERSEERSM